MWLNECTCSRGTLTRAVGVTRMMAAAQFLAFKELVLGNILGKTHAERVLQIRTTVTCQAEDHQLLLQVTNRKSTASTFLLTHRASTGSQVGQVVV